MQDGRLKRILPEWRSEDVTIYLVFRAGHGLRPAVRVFVDHLVRHANAGRVISRASRRTVRRCIGN